MNCEFKDRKFNTISLLKRISGELFFDNKNIATLLEEIGTPSFIFSEKQLLIQYETLLQSFETEISNPFDLAFSVKANPYYEIIKTFIKKDILFEVTSLGEIQRIINLGGNAQNLIYTNIVKPQKTINIAVKLDIGYFAIDSYNDMKSIEKAAINFEKVVRVLIRVNPLIELSDTIFSCTGIYSKIGVKIPNDFSESSTLEDIITYCNKSLWLDLVGIHMHLGSQIIDIKQYQAGIRKIKKMLIQLREKEINFRILDIGGGFPINYDNMSIPSISSFAKVVNSVLKDEFPSIHIIAESGRYLSASAGLLAVSIVNIKKDPQGTMIACLDGSFYNTLPDVVTTGWYFPIEKVTSNEYDRIQLYRFVGSTNDTLDQLRSKSDLKPLIIPCCELKQGDNLVFLQAGAYSLSFNATYCLEERPRVFYIKENGQ